MNRRTQRVSSRIQEILGQILLAKLADPRIDPARTSVTRVEMPDDLLTAKVYVSMIGTEAQQNLALQALRHAGGHLQELMMKQISLRNTPHLQFLLDQQFKNTLKTLQLIDQAMDEIRRKEPPAAPAEGGGEDGQAPSGPDQPDAARVEPSSQADS